MYFYLSGIQLYYLGFCTSSSTFLHILFLHGYLHTSTLGTCTRVGHCDLTSSCHLYKCVRDPVLSVLLLVLESYLEVNSPFGSIISSLLYKEGTCSLFHMVPIASHAWSLAAPAGSGLCTVLMVSVLPWVAYLFLPLVMYMRTYAPCTH
jgi:hypothetical protein